MTTLPKTLRVLNEMQREGVIGEYAIGGAIAAFYYLEPAATFDVDIFISLEPKDEELQFVEAGVADKARLDEILRRHDLGQKWRAFQMKFRPDQA